VPATQARLAVREQLFPRMREPFCGGLRRHLVTAAARQDRFTVFDRGV
jgi:hypothetical protein